MNARSHIFEFSLEGRQIEEVVHSIFNTVLFHRTLGKFHYKQEGSYSVGTIGMEDVECDFMDFTYARVNSLQLQEAISNEILQFCQMLRGGDVNKNGQISLEFYQKKRVRWPFVAESIPWELWTLKIELITLVNEHERQKHRESINELLSDKIMYIAEVMNKHEYVPKMPNQSELELIFDTSYSDVQPYLFKINYHNTGPASMGNTMRKFIKDTLAL